MFKGTLKISSKYHLDQKTMKKIESDITHDRLQQECYMYFHNTYPELRYTLWHTPNEFKRPKSMTVKEHVMELARRKAIGVVAGVTDLCWYHNGTLFIFDIKIGYDKLSEEQIKFIKAIESHGGKFFEINSLDQFKYIIQNELSKTV